MRTLILLLAGLFIGASACVQYHYTPNLLQTPYLEKKGDAMAFAAIGGSPTSINGDFHVSYSPAPHCALMLNYFRNNAHFTENDFQFSPVEQSTRGHLIDGAAGMYTPIAFGTGSIYAGWGLGRVINDFGVGRTADLRYQRFYVQPTFTFSNNWLRLGLGLRLVRLQFTRADVDYRIDQPDIDIIKRVEKDNPFWFPELGGNFGIHIKPVTISAHLVILATKQIVDYNFDGSNLGLSLSYELHDLGRKHRTSRKKE